MTPRDKRTYWLLVAALAVLGATTVYLPGGAPAGLPGAQLPAPRPVLALVTALGLGVVYGGLGYLGLRGAVAAGFPKPLDPAARFRGRFRVPAVAGVMLGGGFVLVDVVLAPHTGAGPLPHPFFPTSMVASVTAAIGEELIFRVLLVGGGYWLLTRLVETHSGRRGAFWAVTLFSAVAFTAAHLPGILFVLGDGDPGRATVSPVLLLELFLLNGSLSVLAAGLLRRYGLLAPVGLHFWVDFVWHVIWGGLQ